MISVLPVTIAAISREQPFAIGLPGGSTTIAEQRSPGT
jgi:hypothetical protein